MCVGVIIALCRIRDVFTTENSCAIYTHNTIIICRRLQQEAVQLHAIRVVAEGCPPCAPRSRRFRWICPTRFGTTDPAAAIGDERAIIYYYYVYYYIYGPCVT